MCSYERVTPDTIGAPRWDNSTLIHSKCVHELLKKNPSACVMYQTNYNSIAATRKVGQNCLSPSLAWRRMHGPVQSRNVCTKEKCILSWAANRTYQNEQHNMYSPCERMHPATPPRKLYESKEMKKIFIISFPFVRLFIYFQFHCVCLFISYRCWIAKLVCMTCANDHANTHYGREWERPGQKQRANKKLKKENTLAPSYYQVNRVVAE